MPDHGQGQQPRGQGPGGLREQVEIEADDPVGPQLGHHRGQQHGAGGGRLGVGIGRPGVEREDRGLDGEGRGEGTEEQDPLGPRQVGVHQGGQLEGQHAGLGLVEEGHGQDAHQQEGRPGEGVDEELDGGIAPSGVAPPSDDEVRRHQGQLEEQEEEDQVEGDEAAQAGRLHQQDPGHEGPRVAPAPGPEDGQGEQQGGHHHQEEGDPVDPDRPVDAQLLGPDVVGDQLVAADPHLALADDDQRQDQGEQADQGPDGLVEALGHGPGRDQGHHGGPDGRGQHQDGEEGEVGGGHQPHHIRVSTKARTSTVPSTMPST